MLRGDLAITPLDEVLRLLADDRATGRLALTEGGNGTQGRTADIYVATGEIYAAGLATPDADAVQAADARLRLRLLAEGTLRPEDWDDALGAQEELFDWSIGELLVELGHLDRASLVRMATEELLDAVAQAEAWTFGSYRFRRRERTRNRAGRTYQVSEFLEAVSGRRAERELLAVPADAVPAIGDAAADLAGLEAAVFDLVDGTRSVAQIEAGCGCTGLEVAGILRSLADRGHVTLVAPAVEAAPADNALSAPNQDDPVSRWSALLDATLPPVVQEEEPHATVELVRSDLPARPAENLDPETAQRRARLRARAAEELLAAQAEAEALREAEVARALLAAGLDVVETLSVVETDEEPETSDPTDLMEASDATQVSEDVQATDAAAEPVETAEAPEALLDLVAEELLVADLPLADVPAEPASDELTEGAQSDIVESGSSEAVADPLASDAVAETSSTEPEVLAEETYTAQEDEGATAPEVEAIDDIETPATDEAGDEAGDEPADEHDPALAAALLRELSSLGLDDEPELAPAARRAPRVPAPRHAAPASRKKRGIFGR